MLERQKKFAVAGWILFWGALSSVWCFSAAHALGPTYDEPFYLRAGLQNWHALNHRELLTQGTMPLPAEVQTLPLFLAEEIFGIDTQSDFSAWLPVARMGSILFWWLLLWASHRLAAWYGGTKAGCFAVALVACEPVLLGHASLATADVAFTACLMELIGVFCRTRTESDWRRRLALPAFWCMLTIMAKASALLFVPMCLGMVELDRLWKSGWRPGRRFDSWKPAVFALWDLALIGLMGLALVFLICPRASRGLLFQIRHNLDGHGGSFLLGATNPGGFWYYFPAALAIKLAAPVFVLFAVLLLVRSRHLLNGASAAAVGLLALTPSFRVQIGVRLVLPIAILAITGAAAAFVPWWNEQETRWRRRLAGSFAAALVLWSLTSAWSVWPHGLCYTNALWGGTSQGYRALNDSNYDWGQGLKELAAWQRGHSAVPLNVCYFGTDPSLSRLPIRPLPLQVFADPDALEKNNRGCFLAVSTNFCTVGPLAQQLQGLIPCDRTMTFLIYDFSRPRTQEGWDHHP